MESKLNTKTQKDNEKLAARYGFRLVNSGGDLYGYSRQFGVYTAFVGCIDSPAPFEFTAADMEVWNFDVSDFSGSNSVIRADSTLEKAFIDAINFCDAHNNEMQSSEILLYCFGIKNAKLGNDN